MKTKTTIKKKTQKEYFSKRDFKTFANGCAHIPAYLTIEAIYCAHATEKTVHITGDPTRTPTLYAIYITTKGSGTIEHGDGSKIKATTGSIYFTTHQTTRKVYSNNEKWDYLLYYFHTDTLELPTGKIYNLQNFDMVDEEVFCNKLIRLMQTGITQNIQKANALLCARVSTWLDSTLDIVEAKKDMNLDRIMAYINANIYEPLHINTMAQDLDLNVKYIQRLFEEKIGATPKEFVATVKLSMVYSLLKASNLSIKDIAKLCSFSTPSHLINNFKAVEGISPSRYRKLYSYNNNK